MDGRMKYGCTHYRRRCKIKAPCCGQIFSCRHCHNEAWKERSDYHVLNRRSITQVICSLCQTEQQVAQFCSSCGECMGEYFCGVCNFFDDDISKEHFHCDGCGDCRTGGRGNFFHCSTCGACYATGLFRNHICIPNSLHKG